MGQYYCCLVLFYSSKSRQDHVLASLTSQRQKNVFTFSSRSCFSPISNLKVETNLYSLPSNYFKGVIYDVHCNIKVHSRIVFLGDCKTIFMFLWLIKDSKPMVDSLINSKRIKRRLKSIHDFKLHTQIPRNKNIIT